jgi:hypothetical protein
LGYTVATILTAKQKVMICDQPFGRLKSAIDAKSIKITGFQDSSSSIN